MGLASLQIQNSNNADVLLDSTLNLFNIIANLCSILYYEVLLVSGNYIVNLLKSLASHDASTPKAPSIENLPQNHRYKLRFFYLQMRHSLG